MNARACAQVMTLTRSGMTLGSDGRDIVRIYRLGSEIAKVVNAVLRPSPSGDEILRQSLGTDAQQTLARIRELVCP